MGILSCRRLHHFFGLMHHRCLKVRMKISPFEMASEELVPTPGPSEFLARTSYLGLAAKTRVWPSRIKTYRRPSAWTIEPQVAPPPGRFSTFQTSSPVLRS